MIISILEFNRTTGRACLTTGPTCLSTYRQNNATVYNILTIMNFDFLKLMFLFTCTMCFEIHIAMNSLCFLHVCDL